EPLIATNFSSRDAAAAVLEQLAEFSPVLEELKEASRRPHSRFNLRYEQDSPGEILLPHLAKIKSFCVVLQLRASAELALGRISEAKSDIDLMFFLTDSTREEPIIISQLVRIEELQLAMQPFGEGIGQWSEAQLGALQQRLQQFDFCKNV